MKSKIFNSKAYQIFDYICRLIILNILLIICSFSIFLIITSIFQDLKIGYQLLLLIPTAIMLLPSIVSIFDTIRQYEVDGATGVFKEYIRSFKKYFLKTLLGSIILVLYILLLINSFNYFNTMKLTGVGYLLGYIFTLSTILMSIMCIIHIPLSMIYFDGLNLFHYLKLSMIFAFKDIVITLVSTAIIIATIILSYYISLYFVLFAFSLPIFFIVKLTKNKYLKISERNKENEKEHDV